MTEAKTAVLYGFHAVGTRLKIAPKSGAQIKNGSKVFSGSFTNLRSAE